LGGLRKNTRTFCQTDVVLVEILKNENYKRKEGKNGREKLGFFVL
jgi:hypothetical protein